MGRLDETQLQTGLKRWREQNEALQVKEDGRLRLRVTTKGALWLYGLGFPAPVILRKDQWEHILASAAEIKTFIRENDTGLR